MKFITHGAVALGAGHLLGMPPLGLAGVLAGSVLPDVIDQTVARLLIFRRAAFHRIHRGASHWFGWWLALLAASLLQTRAPSTLPGEAAIAAGLGFGGFAHVLLDMLTPGGVPMVPWSRKHMISLALCRTGGPGEFLFLVLVLAAFAVQAFRA